jgi:Asp/Glu/hydantoin racemase
MLAMTPLKQPTLGILMLDNHFERYPGDLGNSKTFDFPVLYARTAGATTEAITTISDDKFLEPFVMAAHELVQRGADGIITSCGFLAIYQREFSRRLPVPVAASALLQVPLVERLLPAGRRVGVITFNGASLGKPHFDGVGAAHDTPVVGLAENGCFRRALLGDARVDSYDFREAEAVEAAERLVRSHPEVGAIVLECTNLVPHAAAIHAAVKRPVYDVMSLVTWFYAGLQQRRWPR